MGSKFGQVDIDELKNTIRGEGIHYPQIGLICTENVPLCRRRIIYPDLKKRNACPIKTGIGFRFHRNRHQENILKLCLIELLFR
jgi:hypothetical protein